MARVRAGSPAARAPNRCVDDRDKEAKRLARARAGSDDKALPRGSLCDRLRLMPV